MKLTRSRVVAILALVFLMRGHALAQVAQDEQDLLELRNTVVNLLESLVARGVLTQDEAQAMVADAQALAEQEIAAANAVAASEEDAVRVTYVPEIVREEIQAAVAADVGDDVVNEVLARARDEGWGIPNALPDWVRQIDFSANLRVRGEGAYLDELNAVGTYLDFQAINEAGGIGLAGPDALLNTTEDRSRLVARLNLDLVARINEHVTARVGIATGNDDDPISMNESLANYGRRLNLGVQWAAVEWRLNNEKRSRGFDVYAGRFANPFLTTTLLWDVDLAFEGVAGRLAFDTFERDDDLVDAGVFMTLGAFPLEEVELTADDKWLYSGQFGMNVPVGSGTTFTWAAAKYEYKNIVGLRNAPDSRVNDPTAPALLARGNTLFDIRNDLDPDTNLYALASEFEIANFLMALRVNIFGDKHITFTADYLENRGFDPDDVQAKTGLAVEERTTGRRVGIEVGQDQLTLRGDWRVFAEYRYLERDAVLDAFTDSDFGAGATDTEGYILGFNIGVTDRTWLGTRWLSSNEIDGPPLSVDILQIDVNVRF